ncbi:uncharacterized protein F5Z01DRAFT_90282 [Emericellopsis atlantica]|uniref:N-acetyltransferase domain-containing protein n=1 Tax=Emericellopsis atlantica TaxID=2614577 RepID=A0A9P7ZM77_9HYPO|nr:uncharacterized protein F5Z01DRAFT_90282 [Emericellopsis atlantica]KAG9254708.1 hypothetical protein F5Z01DRAFT_90282 [Emericellopsis atlantica]
MAFIRTYKTTDFEATAHICRATLAPSLRPSQDACRMAPYIWTHQYTHLSPTTCFVLDDGTGRAVGYCIGCPDITTFIEAYPRYVKDILETRDEVGPAPPPGDLQPFTTGDGQVNEACLRQLAYDPQCLLKRENADLIDEQGYWGTMHIDLLDEWQGKGWGRKLIEAFVASVRAQKKAESKGVFIGIAPENDKVVAFYEKMGFQRVDGVGLRMVRDI